MRRLATLVLAATCACSLFVDTSGDQCKTDADCTQRGGPFTSAICAAGICTLDGAPCTTNQSCIDRLGAPAVCVRPKAACVPLLSQDCMKVIGDPANDDAVIVGALFSLSGTNQSSGTARMRSVEVAANDIKQNVPGIPVAASGKARPLVVLECDAATDVGRAATHLATELHVPAIVGPEASGDVITVSAITIPAGTMIISPSATSTAITNLQDDGLVWRTAPSDAVQALALLDQVSQVEQKYRADNATPAGTSLSAAFLYLNDAYGLGLYNAVSSAATFNGKPFGDPANARALLALQYDPKPADLAPEVAQTLAAKTRPALVVGLGSTEVVTKYLTPLEQGWGASTRPLYLFSDAVHKPELLAAAADDALRKRGRGTIPASPTSTAFNGFILKYVGAFGPAPQVFGMAGAYDAMFLLTYGIATAPRQPITGAALAAGFARLVSGSKLEVGGANLSTGFQILATSGGTFNLEGASGPLDFDLRTGEAPSNIDVWCIAKDGNARRSDRRTAVSSRVTARART